MKQLTDQERITQINDMRSFDEQMPCVGIFWYDPAAHSFICVRKKEITMQVVEEAAFSVLAISRQADCWLSPQTLGSK
jgi:hypothetical protein